MYPEANLPAVCLRIRLATYLRGLVVLCRVASPVVQGMLGYLRLRTAYVKRPVPMSNDAAMGTTDAVPPVGGKFPLTLTSETGTHSPATLRACPGGHGFGVVPCAEAMDAVMTTNKAATATNKAIRRNTRYLLLSR